MWQKLELSSTYTAESLKILFSVVEMAQLAECWPLLLCEVAVSDQSGGREAKSG